MISRFLVVTGLTLLVACQNNGNVRVPDDATVHNETCIKDAVTGICTNVITVKHVISIELPVALTSDCTTKNAQLEEPDRTVAINACTQKYVNDLLALLGNFKSGDLP